MSGNIFIEYKNKVVDVRKFDGKSQMNDVIIMWKKRYAHLYYQAEVYIILQSKIN
jgi:hypothetical protein